MVVSGMATGVDVQCNGASAAARLPGGASDVGVVSAAMADVSGDGVVDLVLALANGSVVVASNNGSDWFTALQVSV